MPEDDQLIWVDGVVVDGDEIIREHDAIGYRVLAAVICAVAFVILVIAVTR